MLARRRQFALAITLSWVILGTSFLFLIYERDYSLLENSLQMSVRASADQLADGISLFMKVQDLPSTHRQVSSSYIARTSSYVVVTDSSGKTFLSLGKNDDFDKATCFGSEITVPVLYNMENVGQIRFCAQLKNDQDVLFRKSTVIATVFFVILIGGVLFLFFRLSTADIRGLLARIRSIDPRNPSLDLPENLNQQDSTIAAVYLKLRFLLDELNRIGEESRNSQQLAAVAQMTQMLAHDVRRPFSMLKMLLEGISKAKSPDQIKAFAAMGIPETVRAMNSVNGLIQDVMEIGSVSEVFPAEVKPETILESAIVEVFQSLPESNISISYSLNHSHSLNVEAGKVLRVFSNIFGNAVQAMGQSGEIKIQTLDVPDSTPPFLEFILGNSGPHISEELLPKLFEAFFTSGKKGGTGLGLAIAHKIVVAHQGRIWCESSPGKGVEFHFTLPATSTSLHPDSSTLPKGSRDIVARFQSFGTSKSDGDNEAQLETSLKNLLPGLTRKLSILIVDDEGVYRDSLAEGLTRDQELAKYLVVSKAESSRDVAKNGEFDLAIIDVDLGPSSLSGFEIVHEMRNNEEPGFICIHSNRISASDSKTAIARGADAFLPKPMSRAHLLKLLIQSLERLGVVDPILSSPGMVDVAVSPISESSIGESRAEMVFAFVDDMKTVRMAWEMGWSIGTLKTFASPEKFWEHSEATPGFLESLSCVITDLNFGNASSLNGGEFARQIRNRSSVPILVASNSDARVEDFSGTVDGILGKEPPERALLLDLLARKRKS